MDRFDSSLRNLIHQSAASDHCGLLAPIAAAALAAGLKIHNLHAPHIVEARDSRMDELEAEMQQATGIIEAPCFNPRPPAREGRRCNRDRVVRDAWNGGRDDTCRNVMCFNRPKK
ncbi:MAG: hypothetical protein GX443_06895 [Deltaproteobacteria bacterium]|nr:hypothetical protein [Deltaproteobacteria bacterium]